MPLIFCYCNACGKELEEVTDIALVTLDGKPVSSKDWNDRKKQPFIEFTCENCLALR